MQPHETGRARVPGAAAQDGRQQALDSTPTASGPADEALMHRVAHHDEDAFALLYDRYGKQAYGLACHMLADPSLAEDVVQEAFLNVWRMAGSFNAQRGAVGSWLLSVVRHRAIDVLRQRRGQPALSHDPDAADSLADSADVWRDVSRRLDRQAILQAMALLPQEQRKVIDLAYFSGYTHRELAELLDVPVGTVKGRIRVGMDKLRRFLKESEASA